MAENGGDDSGSESLSLLLYRGFRVYLAFYREGGEASLEVADLSPEELKLKELPNLTRTFHRLAFYIEKLSLFSPNESLDDVATQELIFLLVPFVLGELSSCAKVKLEERLESLQRSLVYYGQFLSFIEDLGLCSAEEKELLHRGLSDEISPVRRRAEKIAAHKKGEELSEQIKCLLAKKKQQAGDPYRWGVDTVDEEVERSLVIALIRRSMLEALNQLPLIRQEIQILEMRQANGTKPPVAEHRPSPPPRRAPLEYIKIKNSGELRMLYRDKVFKPYHDLPTISLAEVAEWEMDLELNRLGARKKEESAAVGVAEKEEAEEVKQREWDDWKDAHPRGIGNKNRNVG